MSVDWITVSAQIVNFLILVWLLKRFLYQPVTDAMARREQRIAARLEEAEAREEQANAEANQYRKQSRLLDERREEILAEAIQEAEGVKKQMLDAGRAEATEARASWLRQANQEKAEFLANLRRESAGMIQAVVRRALADLAGVELEASVADSFIRRLQDLHPEERGALARSSGAVAVTSAFELGPATRSRLAGAIQELLGHPVEVEYAVSAELICGVELARGGRSLSWNVADYLTALTDRLDASFEPAGSATGGNDR